MESCNMETKYALRDIIRQVLIKFIKSSCCAIVLKVSSMRYSEWFLISCIAAVGAIRPHSILPEDPGLDYSHNIFIPLNAYNNYEMFMEYARGSELDRRTTSTTPLPELSDLPESGTHVYSVEGVNCQVELTDESSKRVIKRKTCAEGWTIKNALSQFFADVASDIEVVTGGVIHPDVLKFKKLIFEENGYTLYGDADNVMSSHLQSKIELVEVTFKMFLPSVYTFDDTKIKLSGNHLVGTKSIAVVFLKTVGNPRFKISMDVPQMTFETFATIFVEAQDFNGGSIVDPSFSLTIDPLKSVQIQSSTDNLTLGIFKPTDGNFQLTAKFSATVAGKNVVLFFTVNRNSLGGPIDFAITVKYSKDNAVNSVIGTFVTANTEAFNNKLITNIVRGWYLIFSNREIKVVLGGDYESQSDGIFHGEEHRTFHKGLGLKIPVNLKTTLTSCMSDGSFDDNLEDVKVNGLLIQSGLKFKYPSSIAVPLEAVVKCSTESSSGISTLIPDAIADLESVKGLTLEELNYDYEAGDFKIALKRDGTIEILPSILVLNQTKLEVSKENTDGVATWTYVMSSDVKIFGVATHCLVTYSEGKVTAEVTADMIPLTAFLNVFSFGATPAVTFEIHEFKMQIEWAFASNGTSGDKKISVGGKPVFNGFTNVTVEAIVFKSSTTTNVAVAVVMDNIRLDEVLENILGVENVPMAWFSKMKLVFAISNVNAKGCANPAKDRETCGGSSEEATSDSTSDEAAPKKLKTKSKTQNTKRSQLPNTFSKKVYKVNKSRKNTQNTAKGNVKAKGKTAKSSFTNTAKQLPSKRDDFELATLAELELVEGLYIKASFFLPDDCKKDALCKWMKTKISQETNLYLEGRFEPDGFELKAGVEGEIELSESLMLTDASLGLKFTTTERSVSLSVSLKYTNDELSPNTTLEFTGSIMISFSGKLEIGMSMKGMINEPFNIQRFAFGNLNLAIGITAAGGIPSFQIGCRVDIGNVANVPGKGSKFQFEGYFGFDPTDPTKNYVYARSFGDDLTLINFIRNFGISDTVTLPEPIANSGFFGELIFSFSAEGTEIEALGIEVKSGFYFKGNLRIFDLEIYAEIGVNTDPEAFSIFANISATPISWVNGLLRVQRSSEDDQNGPYFLLDINDEAAKFEIEGFAYCLGMAVGIKINLNDTHSYFHVEGDLFSVLRANLTVAAQYGGSLAEMAYEFSGCISFDLQRIAQVVYDAMSDASRAVSLAMDRARATVERARIAVNRAFEKVEEWKAGVEAYKTKLRERSAELERKKAELDYSCSDKCGEVCVGFLDWNSQCWKVWGSWVGCPKWNSCRWKVADVICIAGCELQNGWNKFVVWAEQVGIQIMLGLTEVASLILDNVDIFKRIANAVLDFAVGFLSVVESFCNGIMTAVKEVIKAAASAIVVDYFCLSGHLKPVESVCVRCRAKMQIIGIPLEWDGELCLDLSFFKSIGQRTANKHTPEIAHVKTKVQEFTSESVKVENDKANMEKEEKEQDNDIKDKTSKTPESSRRRKRSYVPTKEEAFYYDQAYNPIPAPNTRSYMTEQSMMQGAPWLLTKTWAPMKRNIIPDPSSAHKRILDINTKDSCKRMENVYSNYGTIAEGFGTFLTGVDKEKAGFFNMKRSYIDGMNYVKNEFNHGDYKHNVTDEEREHVKYWHDYVINGYTQHIDATEKKLKAQRKTYIPTFREQVESIIGEQTHSSLTNYVDQLHGAVVNTYDKRSDIPTPTITKRVSKWDTLRKTFKELAESDSSNFRDISDQVTTAKRLLQDLRRSEIPCSA